MSAWPVLGVDLHAVRVPLVITIPRPVARLSVLVFGLGVLTAACARPLESDATRADDVEPRPKKRLTVERLYGLPRLIGTAPKAFAWAPDSRRLAFLWNDEGTNFYDVWMIDVSEPTPRRLTRFDRLPVPESLADEVDRRRAAVRTERDPGVSAVAWHPDGTRLLLTFRGDLYWLSPGGDLQRLTDSPAPELGASIAPPGDAVAFLRDRDLWVLDLKDPSPGPRRLTTSALGAVGVESFAWSPDGRRLAFVETDRRRVATRGIPDYLPEETRMNDVPRAFPGEESERRRIGLVAAAGGDVSWLDLGSDPQDLLFGYDWSPDGRELLVDTSDLFVKHRRLLVVDTATGRAGTWLEERDPQNVTSQWWARWAPDGGGIYFVSDRDEDYHVYYRARSRGEVRRVTRGNWAVFDVHLAPAARALFVVGNLGRPEERQVFRVPLDGGEPVRVSWRAGTHSPVVSPDGRLAAVHFSSDDMPPDLFLTRLDVDRATADTELQVTRSPLPEFADYTWAKSQYVTFPNHRDGVLLHGRLTLPPDFDPARGTYPAILGSVYSNTVRNQWGGRTAHPTWGLDQYLAQEGYVLLNVDISGSSGHGKAFRQRIRINYGSVDVEDLYSGVRYLEAQGFVDLARVGIWGSSYGGLLTCMSLFTKPGVYRAGVAGAPATNVWHATSGEMRVMLRPQEQPEAYTRASAFTKAAGLQDPLLIIHGMRDRIVLFKDSVTLVQRLMLLGKDVDFVVLPDAEHGWDTEGLYQTIFAYRKIVAHFERHLGTGPRLGTLR